MNRTVKTQVLEGNPHQTSAGKSGMAHQSGTRLVVFECRDEDGYEDGFYSYLDGIDESGNSFETDNQGLYSTASEAEQEARDYYEETK